MATRFIGDSNSPNRIKGSTDGAAVPAGYVGERLAPITETFSVAVGSTGTLVNLQTLTLTPGVWSVSGVANCPNSYTGFIYATLAISTASASLSAGSFREGIFQWTYAPNASVGSTIASVQRYITVNSNTQIYLVARVGATSGTGNWADCDGRSIQAIRIA